MFYLGKLRNFIIYSHLYYKGITYENIAEYKKALHYLFLAVSLNPKSVDCYKAVARTHLKNCQTYYAFDFYSKAIYKFPKDSELYEFRSFLFRKEKKYDKALEDLDNAIKFDYSNINYYKNRASLKYLTGDIQGAVNDMTAAICWQDNNYKLYEQRAFYKIEMHNFPSAYEDYNKALSINKDSKHSQFMISKLNKLSN